MIKEPQRGTGAGIELWPYPDTDTASSYLVDLPPRTIMTRNGPDSLLDRGGARKRQRSASVDPEDPEEAPSMQKAFRHATGAKVSQVSAGAGRLTIKIMEGREALSTDQVAENEASAPGPGEFPAAHARLIVPESTHDCSSRALAMTDEQTTLSSLTNPINVQLLIITTEPEIGGEPPLVTKDYWDEGKVHGCSVNEVFEKISIRTRRSNLEEIKFTLRTPRERSIMRIPRGREDRFERMLKTFEETMREGGGDCEIRIEPIDGSGLVTPYERGTGPACRILGW